MRRKHSQASSGLSFKPPAKKMKPENIGNHVTSFTYGYGQQLLCSEQTYNALVDQLIKQSSKSNKNKTTLASLMTQTAPNRHKWIIEDKPFISDILSKFPVFKDYDMVINFM